MQLLTHESANRRTNSSFIAVQSHARGLLGSAGMRSKYGIRLLIDIRKPMRDWFTRQLQNSSEILIGRSAN